MGPSQPSLQIQVKVSPPPTQVPPLEQGLEAHVLFLAVGRENMFVKDQQIVKQPTEKSLNSKSKMTMVLQENMQLQLFLTSSNLRFCKTL